MSIEVWKDVKGYEGSYQVSNLGRVKSLSRPKRHVSRLKHEVTYYNTEEKILKLQTDKKRI